MSPYLLALALQVDDMGITNLAGKSQVRISQPLLDRHRINPLFCSSVVLLLRTKDLSSLVSTSESCQMHSLGEGTEQVHTSLP